MAKYGISTYGSSTGTTASEIKNLALFELGFVDEIDFTDLTNETVKKVNRIYSTSLLFVLSNYPWRFILKREELTTRTTATDANKYRYNFTTPTSMITVRTLYSDSNYSNPIREYETYPKYINTDSSQVFIWYSGVVDEEEFGLITGNARDLYEQWIRPGNATISSNLARHIFDQIEIAVS